MAVNVMFAKVRDGAVIPSKRVEDMGFDIYACFDENYIVIKPHETKLIPTGLASACDPGYGFVLFERGSTGSKGMARRCGVIDSGYRDEWFVCISNLNDKDLFISKIPYEDVVKSVYGRECEERDMDRFIVYPYSKGIAQALLLPVPECNTTEMSYDELKNIKSERGVGKLGSSNK